MSFGPVDILFNILVMLLWFRVWNEDRRINATNPYLARITTFTQPILDTFRSLFRGWTPRQAAFAGWAALILFRGLALPALNPEGVRRAWVLRLGFHVISPATCFDRGILLYIVFSILSFAVFLFQVWTFALFFLKVYGKEHQTGQPMEFTNAIARPFSSISARARPFLLLGFGIFIAVAMGVTANGLAALTAGSAKDAVRLGLRYTITGIAGAVDMLLVLRSLLIILIVGSWLSIFTGANALMMFCREWLDFLIGPFRRFPIRLGPLDLTPIVAFFILGIVHWLLNGNLLPRLYMSI